MSTVDKQEILTLDRYMELKIQNYEFEGQSYLFWEFVRLLKEVRPKYFFLENVMMEEKWEFIITRTLGVKPVCVNSTLLSAQNRKRLYWTNIGLEPVGLFGDMECSIKQPKDKHIYLKDILEAEVDEKYYLSDKMINYLNTRKDDYNNGKINYKTEDDKASCITVTSGHIDISDNIIVDSNRKARCFTAGGHSGGLHSQMDLIQCAAMRGRNPENPKSRKSGLHTEQQLEPRMDGKTNTLTTVQKDNLVVQLGNIYDIDSDPQSGRVYSVDGKSSTLNSNGGGDGGKTGLYAIPDIEIKTVINKDKDSVVQLNDSKESGGVQPYQQNRVYDIDCKAPALDQDAGRRSIYEYTRIRRLTPMECERLQTVPDNYTAHVSDTQRYRMIGNGWTVDVIAYFYSHIK